MTQDVETRTYSREDSVIFRITKERFGGLSNMASGFPLEVNGIRIWSCEALYQACRFPHLPYVQKLIIRERSPMTAKMVSKPYRKDSRPDWEKINVRVMRWCLRVKLGQNWETFGSLLLATGHHPIVEESKRDKFWAAEPLEDGTLVGGNVLGRLLMELREELRGSHSDHLRRIEPPAISNFLLLGKPIGAVEGVGLGGKDFAEKSMSATLVDSVSLTNKTGIPQETAYGSQGRAVPETMPKERLITSNGVPRECKRLAEVDFPVAEVSRHSAREKSIRHGHPSTLHLWWARRPLAACRAMLMALLLPDPSDEHCPAEFKAQARRLLAPVPMVPLGPADEDLRKALLKFIGDFANWDNSANPTYLTCARGLVRAAHGEEPPLVVDPFAGGGSIPLEALRVGCDAFASDLNPVACLIEKVLLEDIPREGPGLIDELRRVGKEIKCAAEKELADLYPLEPDGARPIAYLWARTVQCESPKCGAEIPLVRSFWLCKKSNRRRALRPKVVRPREETPKIEFEIFEPKSDRDVPGRTVARAKATCLACGTVLSPDRVRAQLGEQRGGADVILDGKGTRIGGARLLAVVSMKDEGRGRSYRLGARPDYEAAKKAIKRVAELTSHASSNGSSPVPDEPLPWKHGHRSIGSPRVYGMRNWGDYFTARQKLALHCLCRNVQARVQKRDGNSAGLGELLCLVLSKLVELACASCRWEPVAECPRSIFTRHDLPANWDFAESVVISESSGSYGQVLENSVANLEKIGSGWAVGGVQLASAQSPTLPDDSCSLLFTDPPYYDAIAYADLSDFFFVWLKRMFPGHPLLKDPLDPENLLVPRRDELTVTTVAGEHDSPKTKAFFEQGMERAFGQGRQILRSDGMGCVVFAHKTTEGWEALLGAMLRAGWVIRTSWPVTTEMGHRFNARDVAALAASVHLVCRPRTEHGIGGWEDILRELPNRIGDWMERLSSEGIRGADLVFSCIGPALELFSKYDTVETAEGREVKLDEFLEKVWEVVGRTALQQVLGTAEARARNGAAAALEEDARLTALFLWTLQSTNGNQKADSEDAEEGEEAGDEDQEEETGKTKKGYTLIYDVVRRFAQPLGIHLDAWDGRIIEVKKGVVRLLPVLEREEQLFGTSGTAAVARTLERTGGRDPQYMLFPEQPEGRPAGGRRPRSSRAKEEGEALAPRREATTLDRVHAAVLLQARGEATALRALLETESERSPDFLRLANALSALYPKDSEEKRLLDAMLLAVPRL